MKNRGRMKRGEMRRTGTSRGGVNRGRNADDGGKNATRRIRRRPRNRHRPMI